VLAPLDAGARGSVARALVRRVAAARAALLTLLAGAAAAAALLAPGSVSALEFGLVGAAAVLGAGATLASQLALGLERTVAWSLRYPLENAVIVAGALVLYPLAGRDGALAAIALGAALHALALGPSRRRGRPWAAGTPPASCRPGRCASRGCRPRAARSRRPSTAARRPRVRCWD